MTGDPGPPGNRQVYLDIIPGVSIHIFSMWGAGLLAHNASDISGATRRFSCVSSHAAFSPPPPPVVLLHFQMPCHNSTWMCFSQLSPAPAGKTNFLKHRKHPAENILIKQTPHKILFWGVGRNHLHQSVSIVLGDTRRQAGRQELEPNGPLLRVVRCWAHGPGAWPFNLAWIFLTHGSLSPLGISKCIGNLEDLGSRKRPRIFEAEGRIRSS